MASKNSSLNNSSSSRGSSRGYDADYAALVNAHGLVPVSIAASCYLVDNSATLAKNFHYCTTAPGGAEWCS